MKSKEQRGTIIYSSQKTGFTKGWRYSNPRHYDGHVKADVTKCVIMGDWPKVAEAYRKAGIEVVQCDTAGRVLNQESAPLVINEKAFLGADKAAVATLTPPPAKAEAVTATLPIKTDMPENRAAREEKLSAPKEPAGEIVPIPEDWRDLPYQDLRRLAVSVSSTPVVNKAQAIRAIEAEIEKRAAR